ncbi:30S ribosomal protein S19e [Candidatus Bathyarchaeota archaeon]|nr:30S ribosomal protein S19e [Candidatus Bathyarchaeota archaeon]
MPTPFQVPTDPVIEKLTKYLKENAGEVSPPTWSLTAKTGSHRERPPQQQDWWFRRCASLLRKLYIHGPIGVQRLRVEYGGRKRKGRRIEHSRKSGGSSIRDPLQQLEKAGLVTKQEKKGRKLTREGIGLLNRISAEVLKEIKTPSEGQQ